MFFFLINYQSYKYPSQFNRDCEEGVNGADRDAYYSTDNSAVDHLMQATFCADYNDDRLFFKAHTDKTHWKVSTNGGELSDGCDKDASAACCSVDVTVQDFSAHRCYPFWFTIEANCYPETDWMEVLYNNHTMKSNAFKCSSYDNCKGFYYGDNCQYSVPAYDESINCKISLGREGNGTCDCSSAIEMQDYCIDKLGSHYVKYYWRERFNNEWIYKGELNLIHLSLNDDDYYNQYRINGKIVLPIKTNHYFFQLLSKTRANIIIGSKRSQDDLNSVNCDPSSLYTYVIDYGIPSSVEAVEFEIIIDTGCPINSVDAELQWRTSTTSYSTIPNKYFVNI